MNPSNMEPQIDAEGGVDAMTVEEYVMATVMGSTEDIMPMYKEAQKHSDWPKWEEAIQVELKNLQDSGTWKLVKHPAGANIVDCHWVLCIKKNAAGEIEKYKAQLVAKGFTQIYGIDYYKTYAPVAKLASFQLLLVIAAQNRWPVDTFDFNSSYLSTYLGENKVIYLEQPVRYATKDWKVWVWRFVEDSLWIEARGEDLV